MKKCFVLYATAVLIVVGGCSSMLGGTKITSGQQPFHLKKKVKVIHEGGYLLYLPDGYGEEEKDWPLILFLHGAGERGDNLELVKKHGPPKIAERSGYLPFIVLSPQCPVGGRWENEFLITLLDEIVKKYDVDEDRIYLTGLSMGGFGSWGLACEYPERFAAVAPICGGGETWRARNLKYLPVWVFHGAKDGTVPIARSQEMVDALKRADAEVKFTVYPEAQHDSWTVTYDNPELYEWFLSHTRNK